MIKAVKNTILNLLFKVCKIQRYADEMSNGLDKKQTGRKDQRLKHKGNIQILFQT